MSDYVATVKKYTSNVDEAVVDKIVKHLGIALRNKDSSLVSGSDKKELDRVRESWLKKKLQRTESDEVLDKAIDNVVEKMGRSNSNKCRVCFYYLLAEDFGVLDSLK